MFLHEKKYRQQQQQQQQQNCWDRRKEKKMLLQKDIGVQCDDDLDFGTFYWIEVCKNSSVDTLSNKKRLP